MKTKKESSSISSSSSNKTSSHQLGFAAKWIALPCFLGLLVINFPQAQDFFHDAVELVKGTQQSDRKLEEATPVSNHRDLAECEHNFRLALWISAAEKELLQNLSVTLHRNGQSVPCGEATINLQEELWQSYLSIFEDVDCPSTLTKHQVDAVLTKSFGRAMSSCYSEEEEDRTPQDGFLGYCDMGPLKTPILLDHNKLVPVKSEDGEKFLPCHFHIREGRRLLELRHAIDFSKEVSAQCENGSEDGCDQSKHLSIDLYAVPAGRVFMFAPKFVGEMFELPHVEGSEGKSIYLEVLSLNPRVFDVFNFFSREESKKLVDSAIAETKDSHKIKRSSTGASGYNLNTKRTSESGFDTHGETAVRVKERCFEALGFDEYIESHGDGLQILRYNLTTAYTSHLDWIEDKGHQLEHDFESGGKGGNRFATILMYMTDLGEDDGGETVFTKAPSIDPNAPSTAKDALAQFRESDKADLLKRGSWEETMTATCRSKLAIRPHSSRAVLFYSQHPNGQVDKASFHGACPILDGEKYAANLWVWNTPRQGYPGAPKRNGVEDGTTGGTASSPSNDYMKITATFENSGTDVTMKDAKLFFRDKYWSDLGHDDEATSVNTYQGHVWNVKVDGAIVKSWEIFDKDGETQSFEI